MALSIEPLLGRHASREAALKTLLELDDSAFGETGPEDLDTPGLAVLEDDRTLLTYDGEQAVGASGAYSYSLSVPGGEVPIAGVTWVGVRPTHRRRGVMRGMLDKLHAQAAERQEPLAALWAAQPMIYGRFGYGVSTRLLRTVVPRDHGSMSKAPTDDSLNLHMLMPEEDRELTQQVYDKSRAIRPGFPAINEIWHKRLIYDPPVYREGSAQLRTTVVLDENGPRGFVRHAFKPDWSNGNAQGTVNVRHMLALDPAAHATLWRYLIDWDLSGQVSHWSCPSDDPIQYWLDEPRHGARQLEDQLYIKILDVPAALEARTYSQPIDVVIGVSDDDIGANSRRWRVTGDANGAKCTATTDAADLELGVASLAAVYLGGPSFFELANAGWVTENTRGAVEAASAAFSHRVAPYSPFVF